MDIVKFEGCNFTFTGSGDVGDLPCFNNGLSTAFAFRLSPEELEEVKETGILYATVLSGRHFFPIYIGSERGAWDITSRTGDTWKQEHELTPQALVMPDIEPFVDDLLMIYKRLIGIETMTRDIPVFVGVIMEKFKGLASPQFAKDLLETKIKELSL